MIPEEEARLERVPENILGDETVVCLILGATTRWGQLSNVIDPKYHDLCILLNVNSVLKTMPRLIIL